MMTDDTTNTPSPPMPASWNTKNKKLKPDELLKKIDSVKTITPDGRAAFSSSEYHDAMAAMHSTVTFPPAAQYLDKITIVEKAITISARENDLSKDNVLRQINSLLDAHFSQQEKTYFVLTSCSLKAPVFGDNLVYKGCTLRFYHDAFPANFHSRSKAFDMLPPEEDNGYLKLVVEVKAKSERAAFSQAMAGFDAHRAIWSMMCNAAMEITVSDEWRPINKIRLGEVHTVHHADGSLYEGNFWYEPNYVKAKLFHLAEDANQVKNAHLIREKFALVPYHDDLNNALLRYVRALDEKDPNVALVKLWGALEALVCPHSVNNDLFSARISYLYPNTRTYHTQIIEHLREYRNKSVHAGDQSEIARTGCYQLQNYFTKLFLFHMGQAGKFNNLDEVNGFLDLPDSKEDLEKRKSLTELALKLRFGGS